MAEGRKAISKAMRQQVYDSLNGHCGYCGCKITIKEMQILTTGGKRNCTKSKTFSL